MNVETGGDVLYITFHYFSRHCFINCLRSRNHTILMKLLNVTSLVWCGFDIKFTSRLKVLQALVKMIFHPQKSFTSLFQHFYDLVLLISLPL